LGCQADWYKDISNESIFSIIENRVLRARSEIVGYADKSKSEIRNTKSEIRNNIQMTQIQMNQTKKAAISGWVPVSVIETFDI
jgi:hypothetical protein